MLSPREVCLESMHTAKLRTLKASREPPQPTTVYLSHCVNKITYHA